MKHIHHELIVAWANGATIERLHHQIEIWSIDRYPSWGHSSKYRVLLEAKPDIIHGALINLSSFAGPVLYAASPLEANIVLVFDGTTGKLKECIFKDT